MATSSDARSALSGAGRALLLLLRLLPKNALSRAMGWLASRRLPGPLQRLEIALFIRLAGVDRREVAQPLERYASLQAFFTRALPAGARPLEGDGHVLVSPCDGAWGASGRIEEGTVFQLKGRPYRIEALLGDAALARDFEGGWYATFYLSPRDYHRFHVPAAGRITRLLYCPGALWPVNRIGLEGIDALFARNERITALLEVDGPVAEPIASRTLALVAVGATMVGSVRLTFDPLATNRRGARAEDRRLGDAGPPFERGAEWGRFEFGSTIVLLVPPGPFALEPRPEGAPVRLGRTIGRRTR